MEFKKNQLSFTEANQMIDDVYDGVFFYNEEDNTITYLPEMYDFCLGRAIAKYYGNIIITDNAETAYNTALEALESVETGHINKVQYDVIIRAVEEKINFKKQQLLQQHIQVNSSFDRLTPLFQKMLEVIIEKIDKIDVDKASMNELISALTEKTKKLDFKELLEKYITTAFDGSLKDVGKPLKIIPKK